MNDVEITVTVLKHTILNLHTIAIYHSKVPLKLLLDGLLPESSSTTPVVIFGDFNVNLLQRDHQTRSCSNSFKNKDSLHKLFLVVSA